jgi:hypothetical protein
MALVSIHLVIAVGLLGGAGLAEADAVAQSGAARRPPGKEGVKPGRKAHLLGPPRTWKQHWFEHDRVIKLVSSNDDVAVYFDDDVPRGGLRRRVSRPHHICDTKLPDGAMELLRLAGGLARAPLAPAGKSDRSG